MIELILGTYGALCWLLFKKFRVIPVNTYTVFTAIGIAVVFMGVFTLLLMMFHPASNNARTLAFTTPIVSQLRGIVVDVPVTPCQPLKKGAVLFRVDPAPYQYEVERFEAMLANAQTDAAQIEERFQAAEAVPSGAGLRVTDPPVIGRSGAQRGNPAALIASWFWLRWLSSAPR